ncbi:MAG: FtsX-like permease family protein [Euryarchaeota archaeon]|nr:FtsX-like permease family protein [Euryarchaeota archaeon]
MPLLLGLRRRIFVRMAARNVLRRKRQSLMIAAGLMVGTAIVASAEVAGDSMGYAIRRATLDAFELIDETVFLDGYAYYPESVEAKLADDAVLRSATDAIGSNIIWDAAVTDSRTGLYEPSVRLVGFDPEKDKIWGDFRHGGRSFDGTALGPNDAVLNDKVAQKLDARVGDTIVVNTTLPQDPLIPTVQNITGVLNVTVQPGGVIPTLLQDVVGDPYLIRFQVGESAVRVNVFVLWQPAPPARQDLDAELLDPTGRVVASNRNGTLNAPDIPVLLFHNQSIAKPLQPGTWTLRITGEAAARTAFEGNIGTFYAVYSLAELEKRAALLERQFGGVDTSAFTEPPRRTIELRVAEITSGGKGPNFQLPNQLSMYLRMDTTQKLLEREGQINFLKVSNPGGKEDGADRTDEVYPILWERLNATKEGETHPAILALRANNDKQYWLAEADRYGELFGVFLTFVGSFSIIAGLLLIVNIFTMLAEERKVELAMARAVGLKRNHLVQLFTFEGIMYALPAAFIGTFFGLGLAWVLVTGFNRLSDPSTFPPISFRLETDGLVFAFSVGILLTVATVYLGARRASRLNIVSAIRSLDDPPHLRGLRSLVGTALITAAGVVGTLFALATNSFTWQLLGPTALAIGLALILRRFISKNTTYPLVSLGLFAYLVATLFAIEDPQTREADVIGPIRSVVMTLCVVVFVVYSERFTRLLGRLASYLRPLRPVALVAISYPLHKKFRTGMTLAMFSVILLVVMLFSIIGALFFPDVEKESGGYHVEAVSGLSFATLEGRGGDPRVLDGVERYDVLPNFVRFGADLVTVENETTGQFGPPQNTIFGMGPDFAEHNGFTLVRRLAGYATDRDAYRAVASSADLAIVSYEYSTDRDGRDGAHVPGDYLQLRAKGSVKEFQIVGVMEQYHFRGVFLAEPVVHGLFPNTDSLVLFRLKDPADDEAMAKRIEANYKDLGLDANSIRTRVLEENESFRQIFTLIRVFLSLGLIVGILSLGIVTARSVIERRQEIGMMRAVGYLRRHIRRTFLLEMLTVVTLGILIGTAVAILVSYAIWYGQVRELRIPFSIPWAELLTIAGIAYVVTTLSTLSPIFRAARTPPADALRYIE